MGRPSEPSVKPGPWRYVACHALFLVLLALAYAVFLLLIGLGLFVLVMAG